MTAAIARILHRAALRAYPTAFRREFGLELDRIFAQRVARARQRSVFVAITVALYGIADALVSGVAERLRRREERWAWPRHAAHYRSTRSNTMSFDSLSHDVRYVLRQMRRAPLFAALTIASLALGIGFNTAMFAVVEAVLLRPLPYDEPSRLVTIWSDNTKNAEVNNPVSPANFEAFRAAPALSRVEGFYSFVTPALAHVGVEPEPVIVSQVTPGLFSLLGRAPLLGHKFDDKGTPDGVILSHQFWKRRFGGNPDVLGTSLKLSGGGASAVLPVIGVMPEDFTFPYGSMLGSSGFTRSQIVDMWWPISRQRDPRLVDAAGRPSRSPHYFGIVGRLRPGITLDRARADLAAIALQRAADFPDTNAGWGITLRTLHEQTVGKVKPALLILMAGVSVVLLITCINVANVLLARAAGRGRDLAVRSALGASPRRLIQQSLVESVLLSVAGGVAGLGVMVLAVRGILALAPPTLPRIAEVSPGLTLFVFAVAVSIVSGLGVGVIPGIAAARSRAQDSLRDGVRTTASRTRQRARAALIIAEVALAMTLTVAGGLLLRSFVSVLNVDPGFDPDRLLTMQIAMPPRHGTPEARLAFYDELEQKLKALPGVRAVGGTTRLPLGSTNVTSYLEVEGRPFVTRAELPEVEMRRALYDYFAAMEIPLLRGRTFTRDDRLTAPPVAVINNTLATRVFPHEDPVGKRIRFGPATEPWITIVGIVGDIRHGSLEEVPKPEFYITSRQGPPVGPFLVIRSAGDPAELAASVRQTMRELGADPPRDIKTMEAVRSTSVAPRRFVLLLVGMFGVLALGLAALGVFGVITLIAAERTTEVGIRLALGARPAQVLRLVIGHALKLAAAGIAIGGTLALLLRPTLRAQLYGVGAADPVTYVGVATALLLTALLAAYLPARRAMRVDPAAALRN